MLNGLRPPHQRQRGDAAVAVPLVAAVVISLALIGAMVGMACMGPGHMGMMRRGSSGADQTPVVSDAEQVTVEMRNYEFFSARLTVNAGTEVTWVNRDGVPHNAVAADGAFDTGNVNGGESVSVVVEQPGTYPYVCSYHPGMEGVLTVF
jgi:plastocyanin